MSAVTKALQGIRSQVAAVGKQLRLPYEPRLVAVSKTKPNELVLEAYTAGQRHFGENYVQELVGKAPDLPQDINWHFIGALQSNKCKVIAAVPNLWVVETVGTQKLANHLNRACDTVGRKDKLKVMVQVNTSGEESKSGCALEECTGLVKHVLSECNNLEFIGLMTIGDFNPEPRPDCFLRLIKCRDALVEELGLPKDMELSMGMSHDFAMAIEHGATNVRVGSSIFGAREKK